jgi:UDP-glucose 4-epimerase
VDGHRVALEHLDDDAGLRVFNLGTGVGTSVRQLVTAFSDACGMELPHRIVDRRPGDVRELIADPSKATSAWGWRAQHGLTAMCRDAWRFQRLNPAGYGS